MYFRTLIPNHPKKLYRSRDMTVQGSWSNFSLGLGSHSQHICAFVTDWAGLELGSNKRVRVSNRRLGPARERVEKFT